MVYNLTLSLSTQEYHKTLVKMDTFSKPAVVATQLVLYMNDTLYISYSDGSSLQLSPCGAAFTHHHAIDSQAHTLHGMRSIQQRTQFVTSEYRHKLDEAIDFRNRFASRPFVSENLHAESSNLVSDVIVLEAVWPHDHKNAHIEYLSDQQIQLRAINRSAVLTLGANKQHFTVRYLVQIQMEAPSSVWISSHYSILSYPECWNHPIKLLLLAAEKSKPQVQFNLDTTSEDTDSNNTENCQHQQESNKSGTETQQHKTEPNKVGDHTRDGTSDTPPCKAEATVITLLPQALPLNCPSQHLHRWQKATDTQTHGKIKIFCSNAIIYRFLWGPPCIEIYPGDGSTLRATSSAAHFFTHYIMVNEQYAERMYSVDNPPIRTHGVEYCIAKLITTAARLLHQFTEDNLDLLFTDTEGCWQIATSSMPLSRTTHTPVTVIEQCVVDGLGRFTAFNNGRIRVVFTDRTCMDMKVVATPTSMAKESNDLIEPACKLLLPNGRYHNVDARHPGDYKSYIDCGLDWVRWVTTPAASRETFYKGTVHDPDTHRSVVTELKKIQCFNYITDNALPHLSPREPVESSKLVESPKCAQTTGFQEDFTPDMVQQIIKQNSSIVADIEEILHN